MDTAIHQASKVQQLLRFTYGFVPIVAGLDKFTNLLTDWENYLSAPIADRLPISAASFMTIVGIIEIVAGLLVLWRPRIGGYVVMIWLIAVALTLIIGGHYYDVAVRDLVMSIGAFSLARLSTAFEREREASLANA